MTSTNLLYIYVIIINVVTFFIYGLDKMQGKSRTVAHIGSAADISGGDRRVGGSSGRYEGISS